MWIIPISKHLVGSIPENKLNLRRGVGFWTIAEHVSHLAQVQPMLSDRIYRLITEACPEFVPYLPGKEKNEPATPARMNMPAALEQFEQYRNKQLALHENTDEKTWQKTAVHPEYDQYSLHILVRHILMHDYWHMYRMEELWLTKDAYLTKME